MSNLIKVTRALAGVSISGKLAVAALQGNIVQIKASTLSGLTSVFDSAVEVQLATGTRGFLLERPVIDGRDALNQPAIPYETLILGADSFITPELIGNTVSARAVQEFEVEGDSALAGPGLVLTSGSPLAISNTTPIGSELSTDLGRICLRSGNGTQGAVAITANSAANPTVVTAAGHGLRTGDKVVISGSNSTPVIDGLRTVTVISANTFSVPVDCTGGAGTAGSVRRANGSSAGDELFGWLRGILASLDGSNAYRYLVEVAQ